MKSFRFWFIALTGLCLTATTQAAVILQYHHVSDETPRITSISPALFETHMEYLEDNGFTVWSLPRLVEQISNGKPIPDKVVSITFDDAYDSIYHRAFPLLKKRGWPFTVFVSTRPVEQKNQGFMTWQQLKEMANQKATIANHTHSHAHLVRKPDRESDTEWLERVQKEISEAQTLIEQNTGQKHKLLAYPYGEHTKEISRLVESMGFTGFGQQSGAVGAGYDMTALPRFPMNNNFGAMEQFRTKVSSLPMNLKKIVPNWRIITNQSGFSDGLTLTFQPEEGNVNQLNCYLSFQGKTELSTKRTDAAIVVTIPQVPLPPVGRSRINCTMPSMELPGRFRWASYFWMRKNPDGSWYPEP